METGRSGLLGPSAVSRATVRQEGLASATTPHQHSVGHLAAVSLHKQTRAM